MGFFYFVYLWVVDIFFHLHKVAKFDTETKKMVHWSEENCWPSEPVFVPRPNGESEDDGEFRFFERFKESFERHALF